MFIFWERTLLPGMFGGGGGDHGPGIREVLPGFLKKFLATQSRILENPQRLDYAFKKILSNVIKDF